MIVKRCQVAGGLMINKVLLGTGRENVHLSAKNIGIHRLIGAVLGLDNGYVTVLNLSELPQKTAEFTLPLSGVASVLLFAMLVGGNLGYYTDRYENEKENYKHADYVLSENLPADASVACSTFLLPHIADRDVIYEVTYHKENGKYKTDVDYVVLDTRYAEDFQKVSQYFLENGYEELHNDGGYVYILKKK
jgi:hypothetical protein